MKKKALSLLLTLAMVLSLVSAMGTVVSAAEPEPVTLLVNSTAANDEADRLKNAEYQTLEGALDKAISGDTIKLGTDISLSKTVEVSKKLTLDLGCNKLSVPFNMTIKLLDGADLTITGNGHINTRQQMFTITGGKLTIENGTYTKDSENSEGGLINCKGGGTVLINGGSYSISGGANKTNYAGFLLYSGEGSEITVNAGTFTATTATSFKPLLFGTDTVGKIYIKGGAWTGENYTYAVAAMRSIVITGGTFNTCNGKDYSGTDIDLADYLPKGYHLAGNSSPYTVKAEENFKIDNTFYPTLNSAVAAAKQKDEIIVNANVTVDELVNIEKELTLDLNGKTLTLFSNKTSRVIEVLAGGTLTVKDSSTDLTGLMKSETLPRLISVNGGVLIIKSGSFETKNTVYKSYVNVIFCEAGSVSLEGGTYSIPDGYGQSGDESWYSSVIAATQTSAKPSTVTITGGTYNGAESEYFRAKVITSFKNGDAAFGTINVQGGTFNGSFDISSAENLEHIIITGGRFDHLNLVESSYTDVSTLHDIIDSSQYYILTESGAKTYYAVTFGAPVCQIGADKYDSIANALKAAHTTEDSDSPTTITLIANDVESAAIPEGRNIILDLNGFVLSAPSTGGSVITNNGTLTITDSNPTAVHKYVVGTYGLWAWNDGAEGTAKAYESLTERPAADDVIAVKGGCITGGTGGSSASDHNGNGGGVANNGKLTISGGNVIGNTTNSHGGGIYNYNNGTLTISGGNVIGNKASMGSGGGIYNTGSSTLTISNGEIAFNTAQSGGGGVSTGENVTVRMEGGKITGNNANHSGGVYNVGTFTMTGGTITGNNAKTVGGGVNNDPKGTITVGGTAKITGNKNGTGATATASNVYLPSGKTIGVAAAGVAAAGLAAGAEFGVTTKDAPSTGNPVAVTGTNSVDYSGFFFSDNEDFRVVNSGSKSSQVVQLAIAKASITKSGATKYFSTVQDAVNAAAMGDTVKMLANSKEKVEVPGTSNIILDLAGKELSSVGITIFNYGTLTICDSSSDHSGKISTADGDAFVSAILNDNTLYVTGGTITADGDGQQVETIITEKEAKTEISGQYTTVIATGLECDPVAAIYVETDNSIVSITDGKFNGELIETAAGELSISGGWFSEDPTDYLVQGCAAKDLAADKDPYKYEVVDSVCKIGDKEYSGIAKALKAAHGSEDATHPTTITLIANDVESATIPEGRNITLDLNGFVLKGTGSGSVITNNGTLTIQDSSLELPVIERNNHRFKVSENGLWENDDSIASDDADYIYDGPGEMHAHKQTVPAVTDEGTVIVIYGGCITGGTGTANGESGGVTNKGTFTLASGNIIGNSPADSDGCQGGGVTNSNNGTFVMNGGSIIGNYSYRGGGGVFNYNGTVRVNDGAILFNTAKESGGGIGNDGAVIITGGSICKNAAGNIGGGMYINGGIQIHGGPFIPGGSLIIGGTAKIYDNSGVKGNNVVIFSNNPNITIGTSTNGTDGNEVLKPAEGMRVGITLLAAGDEVSAYGAFTTNGAETDKQYFFSDDPAYLVKYNTNHLELVYAPKLYFGMYGGTEQARRFECSIYTDAQRTNAYTGGAGTWSVQWVDGKGMQLNLTNFTAYNTLQIDTACFIALTGTNSLDSEDGNGLIISENCDVTFEGTGVLNASSAKNDAVAVNAAATVNGATLKCSAADADKKDIVFGTNGKVRLVNGDIQDKSGTSFYPDTLTTLYLAKKAGGSYALFKDFETCNFEYAVAANGVEEQVGSEHYAVVNLTGALDKNVIFKQIGDPTYTAALRVNGTVSMMGFDAGENALTILNGGAAVLTAYGDIKADKIYVPEMTLNMVNGSFAEASAKQTNLLSVGGAVIDIQNGSIDFEKGTVTIGDGTNPTAVTIEKNGSNAAEFGIKAHTIHVNKAALTVKDVTTGVSLYDPLRLDDDGATLNLTNGAAVNITASGVGVQGTAGEGGYYYNNITVADTSTITITGGQKAVASAVISPIPEGKVVSSADPDHKPVTFTINSDANFTTDYYYAGTTTPATALTLIDAVSVTFDTMGGSSTPIAWVAPGTAVTKPADPTRAKSLFSGWYLNGQAFDFSTKLTEDITLEAHWTLEETETGEETTIATDGSTTTKVQVMGDDGVQASGLESVAKEVKADGNTANNVKIVLTAEKTVENSGNSSEVSAIKTEAGDKSIDLLVIDLTKYINSADSGKITDTGSNVIEVIIPFSSANKQNIAVYRYHSGAVPPVTVFEEKTKAEAGADGTFYIENGELHLFTTKFSTYAIGYKTTSGSIGGGGDGTGSTGKKDEKTVEKNGVCPQDNTCVYAKFNDSDPKAWYHPGVHFCVEKGYMNGVSATKFAPSGTLSRGMIVTMLWRMEGSPVLNYAMSFKDVAADQWYTEAIRWAQSTGVVKGYDEFRFGPNDNVTREQLAAILMRYAAFKGIDVSKRADLSKFTDAKSVSGWALENVKWANAVGIINGRTETSIAPTGNATRAEAANMVQRFCETILK